MWKIEIPFWICPWITKPRRKKPRPWKPREKWPCWWWPDAGGPQEQRHCWNWANKRTEAASQSWPTPRWIGNRRPNFSAPWCWTLADSTRGTRPVQSRRRKCAGKWIRRRRRGVKAWRKCARSARKRSPRRRPEWGTAEGWVCRERRKWWWGPRRWRNRPRWVWNKKLTKDVQLRLAFSSTK